jgi:hypothetical protein
LLTTLRDPFDDICRHVNVQVIAREIVQEEKGLGSLDQQVVDTHGHEVDPFIRQCKSPAVS